jgi:hypothetical protein
LVFQLGEKSLAALHSVNCGKQIATGVAFAKKTVRAQTPCFLGNLAMGVDGDNQNLDGRVICKDFAAGIKTADVRHADIQQDQVGLALARFLNDIVAVDGFAADFQIRTVRDQAAQAAADPLVVIG